MYNEKRRPQIHFSPRRNWINDPNGCVYHDGLYHLYYQHHPHSMVWGPMHWGHAISEDLVHWSEKDIALYPDTEYGMAFSGSAVVDADNTSGLFDSSDPAGIVYFYTLHKDKPQRQQQAMAYSKDGGKSLTIFANNPIIPDHRPDARDPKVFWHGASESWVMIIAAGDHLELYRSGDLIDWDFSSSFTIEGVLSHEVYECPDLFSLKDGDEEVWFASFSLLEVREHEAIDDRSVYVEVLFDGHRCIQKGILQPADQGCDFYAHHSWSGSACEKKVWIGWANNWLYARDVPTDPWRGVMSLPRVLGLVREDDGSYLISQHPVKKIMDLIEDEQVISVENTGTHPLKAGKAYQLILPLKDLDVHSSITCGNRKGESFTIRVDKESMTVTVDRSRALMGLDIMTGSRMTLESFDLDGSLEIIIDASIVEIFNERGTRTMTNQFFTEEWVDHLKIEHMGVGSRVTVRQLASIWDRA